MKKELSEQLKALMEEAENRNEPAMYVVLSLLLGAYEEGEQGRFATHCSKYSKITFQGIGYQKAAETTDPWTDNGPSKRYH